MVRGIGMILMLCGIGGMVWGAWDYFSSRESVEIGGTRLVIEDKKMPVQGLVGLGLFGVGAATLLVGNRRK
jgi:hypothetical protein